MNRPSRYLIKFVDGSEEELPYCKLRLSIKGDFLFQEDPSDYGEGIQRTFPVANLLWWRPVK